MYSTCMAPSRSNLPYPVNLEIVGSERPWCPISALHGLDVGQTMTAAARLDLDDHDSSITHNLKVDRALVPISRLTGH